MFTYKAHNTLGNKTMVFLDGEFQGLITTTADEMKQHAMASQLVEDNCTISYNF